MWASVGRILPMHVHSSPVGLCWLGWRPVQLVLISATIEVSNSRPLLKGY